MFPQTLHRDEASRAPSAVAAQPQPRPVEVPQTVQREVSWEPGRVHVQRGQRVLDDRAVQPRQALGAGHVTRVVELVVGEVERILLAEEGGLRGLAASSLASHLHDGELRLWPPILQGEEGRYMYMKDTTKDWNML